MRINSIHLKNFQYFDLSDLEDIRIDFHRDITVAMGTNGSGKTKLFQELNPLPTIRSNFKPGGYKCLELEHRGDFYTLTTDFTNRISPHSFLRNGEELNAGGTTQVQTELALTYLGYDQTLHDLTYLNCSMCHMSRADRKSLFIKLNPNDLSLALDIHKRTTSRLKEYKNNLSHLYQRKTEIQNQLLQENTLLEIRHHRQELEQQTSMLDKLAYAISRHLDQLNKHQVTKPIPTIQELEQHYQTVCKQHIHSLINYQQVSRTVTEQDVIDKQILEASLSQQIEIIQQTIDALYLKLDEYRTHLKTVRDKPIDKVESEIKELTGLIDQVEVLDTLPILDIRKEPEYLTGLNYLTPFLLELAERDSRRIWPTKTLHRVQRKIERLNQDQYYLQRQIQQTQESLKELEDQVDKTRDLVPSDCTFSTCGLKTRYLSRQNDLDKKQLTLMQQLKQQQRKYQRLVNAETTLTQLVDIQQPIIQTINDILDYWHRYPLFSQLTDQLPTSLLELLLLNPRQLIQFLEQTWHNSCQWHQRQEYQTKLDLLKSELANLIKANTTSSEFMIHLIQENEKQLQTLIQQLQTQQQQLADCRLAKSNIQSYLDLLQTLDTEETAFKQEAEQVLLQATIDYYQRMLSSADRLSQDINRELRSLDATIREQDALQARYQEEVLNQTSRIESRQIIYTGVEQVLSPNTGIPQQDLILFINKLIHNVNYFINQVFNYPLQLKKLDLHSPLDFNLPIQVNNKLNKDISRLSKGQTEIVDLAWVLAILLQKKALNQYPLFLDEIGYNFDQTHQESLLRFLNNLQETQLVTQMFMVNHFVVYSDGINNKDVICLKVGDMILPENVNQYVQLN